MHKIILVIAIIKIIVLSGLSILNTRKCVYFRFNYPTNNMTNKEALVLSDTFQKTRDLTRWYLSLLKDCDPYKRWEVNGTPLNSIIWLASHLVWAQNYLVLKGTGGELVAIDWSENYNIRSNGDLHHNEHNMKTVMASLKEVNEKATAHLLTISD